MYVHVIRGVIGVSNLVVRLSMCVHVLYSHK